MANGSTISQGIIPLLVLGVVRESIRVTQGRKPRGLLRPSRYGIGWLR